MDPFDFDVIICGGGPAGSTCALGFINTDVKVAVLEKSSFPREKVCGDGLADYVPLALNIISPDLQAKFFSFEDKLTVSRFSISSFDGARFTRPLPRNWYCSTRYHFDHFLYQQASALPNVTHFLEQQVKNIEVQPDRVMVTTAGDHRLTAKMLIGCDGATSFVRRTLTHYEPEHADTFATVRTYFSGVNLTDRSTYEIFLSKNYPHGYFWAFPAENGLTNVGIGMLSSEVVNKKLKLREVLLEVINELPAVKEKFRNAKQVEEVKGGIIPFGYGKFPLSGNRFMLCGDAACLADPSSGEGIGPAMVSGRIAAFHALSCIKKNDFSAEAMKGYDRTIDKKFGWLIRRRKFLAGLLANHPWIANKLFQLMNKSEFVISIVGKSI